MNNFIPAVTCALNMGSNFIILYNAKLRRPFRLIFLFFLFIFIHANTIF